MNITFNIYCTGGATVCIFYRLYTLKLKVCKWIGPLIKHFRETNLNRLKLSKQDNSNILNSIYYP